ncbi:hypothetical protein NQ176_g10964 [Zarea fungicola]|uniref:Uncharacterized protein n=1 Tax=Zarea fungicola TaxID=93591 RepID=A0ACC1MDM0_9HYPO|nr:hypothetical protein NQ176_g10964 [Lecanicillium fungicola]
MTWGCKLGFQRAPTDPFYVPAYGFDPETLFDDDSDQSQHGYYAQDRPRRLAGHEGPEYAPAAAFRTLEKLLGRINSFTERTPFTLPQLRNITQPKGDLGNGTVTIPCYGRGC